MADNRLQHVLDEMRHHLRQEVLPFWMERTPDVEFGGFFLGHDNQGQRTGAGDKMIITQLRMIWTFAAAAKEGFDAKCCKRQRDQGFNFLNKYFVDAKYGGYYWTCNRQGEVIDSRKRTVAQCYALYICAEVFLLTGEKKYLDSAWRAYEDVISHCFDSHSGGFNQILDRNWSLPPGEELNDQREGGIHSHIMLGLDRLYRASGNSCLLPWIRHLYEIITTRMIHPEGFFPIGTSAAWKFSENCGGQRTWFGHSIELVWYLSDAATLIDEKEARGALPFMKILAENVSSHGIDSEKGGVFLEGSQGGTITSRDRHWWVQQEALIGYLRLYILGENPEHLKTFLSLYDWCIKNQIDPNSHTWIGVVDGDGKVIDDSIAHMWKSGFHTIRMLRQCCSMLEKIIDTTAVRS